MIRSEIIRFIILRSIGNFLLLFSIFGVVATFGPSLYYEAHFRVAQVRGVHYTIAEPQKSLLGEVLEKQRNIDQSSIVGDKGFAQVLSGPKEQVLIPKDTNFSIVIPKIGANSQVFPNIDSSNENEFLPILQKGVAHAKGTVFPGKKGNIYLFAHSTDNFWDVGRYNAVFYLLKDLTIGDEVVMFFENNRYNYKVSETKIVDSNDVSSLVNSQKQNQETLILQTCWPPGTTWKRLLVIAKPK
ncbi:MAG: sortase [Candidatus Levybacteria bacterium]|nr:sortase [Candidatus Levybacteria bacterium]